MNDAFTTDYIRLGLHFERPWDVLTKPAPPTAKEPQKRGPKTSLKPEREAAFDRKMKLLARA